MEIQTWLSRHHKFISAENITILLYYTNEELQFVSKKTKDKKIKNRNKNKKIKKII